MGDIISLHSSHFMKGIAAPRLSASILFVRPNQSPRASLYNYTVLMLQRKSQLAFGSSLVFPGGTLDKEADSILQERLGLSTLLHATALRECFEETGMYLANEPLLQSQTIKQLTELRTEYIKNVLYRGEQSSQHLLLALGQIIPPTTALIPYIRLITVPQLPSRYDTSFFVQVLRPYQSINFQRFAEHDKYLHDTDNILKCEKEFVGFRWMDPLQCIGEHAKGECHLQPPQYIMLNAMMGFFQWQGFLDWLHWLDAESRGTKDQECSQPKRLTMGPNVVSLIRNQDCNEYPYSGVLLGDSEFPYSKIHATQQIPSLRQEILMWESYLSASPGQLNRLLFTQSRQFFKSKFSLQCTIEDSILNKMRSFEQVNDFLAKYFTKQIQ